ncbi:uncharacterized protein BDR25DRAFT_342871 [Lindgomyces ingoldianus]|uniref:Uncharacterized protein n=1 Tax=Lindgomyces ingoldianus TaxID=673940 RepID=A0ACB6QVU1_9PLEO|nr:uncharacterized protein BDR25DRAFT_342871 [Lindgomyces ingoldianus]KAF2471118.1 hypothetical protein BDR25DRAFT_342871 [Lindgomyces ingoldianus]
MSKVNRMQILGVRSFDNKQHQNIVFWTPLTLIVGYNGSGKTTIIECLKYATTGELPPNSKTGGAFIHDPKLCGEKEVMARVQLSFTAASGSRMVVDRKLQLTVKKASRSQKTLDCSLLIAKDGEKSVVSSRVAHLDQILPQYLGVSKAVLENVIFCHQDDSLWPMSEPSALKKKFDEIFEAQKYTKAIDNIKILRKKHTEELGKFKLIEQHAKEDRDRGERARKKADALFDEIETLNNKAKNLEERVAEAKMKSKEAFDHAARFEQIVAQLNGKRITLRANQESVVDLEANLKQMLETDEDLHSMLNQYEERVALYGKQQEELRKEYSNLKQDLDVNRESLGVKQSEIGKYQAQKEQHERHLSQRETLIKETAKRHGIRGFDYDITDSQVTDFLAIIGKMSSDQNRALDRARKDTQEELRNAQNGVNQLNEQKSVLTQRKEMSRSQIAANDRRVVDLQRTMDKIDIDEGGEAILKDKKNETEQRLKTANANNLSQRFDDRIRDADAAQRNLDERKESLEAELVNATRLARDSAQIEYAQDELQRTKRSLETMKGAHGSRIAQLVEVGWDPATLSSSFERAVTYKATEVKEAESRRDISQSKLDNINFKLSTVESEQKKKRTEFQKCEKAVQDAIGSDDIADFEQTLQEREEIYETTTMDQAKFQAQLEYMRSCLKTAKEDDRCRLCKRSLKDDRSEQFKKAEFITSIEQIITKAEKAAREENADEMFAELEDAKKAKPSYDLAMRLRHTELPTLQSESTRWVAERDVVNKELEEQDAIIQDLQTSKMEVESLSKNVQSIVNSYNQARDLEKKILELSEKQKAAGFGRSIDDIQEELKKIGDEVRSAKAVLASVSEERDKSRNLVNTLEFNIRDINAELNSAQSKLKEKRALAERMEELKTHSSDQREAIRGYDRDIQNLVPQIEQAQLKYDDINSRGSERVQRLQDDASKLSDSVRQLSYAENEITAYKEKGGPQQLARSQREFEILQAEISRVEEDMIHVTRQVKKIDDTLRDTDNTKRSISDNLRYRKAKRSLQTLQAEIQELETNNAEKDQERWDLEGNHWQNEWNKLTTMNASLLGTMKEKDEQLKDLEAEWQTDFQDANYKYREAHIKVETTKAAVEDLGRYGGALDKAIMKYHTLKMEEINSIIEELWRQAYQGTDVDSIRIRSDNETGKGNRSYNYRVVMVKQEVEMDMRGRCSAGQKVLASIVIRLALAECFGTNCGLIALDEPTTNLDQENIIGLASALSEIIKVRKKQANFQLIVITHDEEFLRAMNCSDYATHYYRVTRDGSQNSLIELQDISLVSK